MGGVWERQIRTVRSILAGLVKKSDRRLSTSTLQTFLYEVMAIINSRPLSVESLEDPLGPLPLTPNHILTAKSAGILPPPGVFESPEAEVRKSWRRVQSLADEFWRRWRTEYLTTLQFRRKWSQRQPNLAVGDVVLMRDETLHRMEWRLARVEEVYPGEDGLVRRCKVTRAESTAGSGVRRRVLRRTSYDRPVHKLTLLVRAEKETAPDEAAPDEAAQKEAAPDEAAQNQTAREAATRRAPTTSEPVAKPEGRRLRARTTTT